MRLDDVDGGGCGHADRSLCKMPSGRAYQPTIPSMLVILLGKTPESATARRPARRPAGERECCSRTLSPTEMCGISGSAGVSPRSFHCGGAWVDAGQPRSHGQECRRLGDVQTFVVANWQTGDGLAALSRRLFSDIHVDFTNVLDNCVAVSCSRSNAASRAQIKQLRRSVDAALARLAVGLQYDPAASRHAPRRIGHIGRGSAQGIPSVRSASELTPSIRQGQYRRARRGPFARRARLGEPVARSVGDEVRHDRADRLLAASSSRTRKGFFKKYGINVDGRARARAGPRSATRSRTATSRRRTC